ncbi:MFS general substrate transporter [Athelia psychrophila]|uniref:MFS general substrate transporter n=1 Tax=Athelia psychrophila TaxID=1759441 RepID=A0A166DM46_9AGAM|nr:MFS general substrate transporter [Fibularhizoctonia sp. CBS 109695]
MPSEENVVRLSADEKDVAGSTTIEDSDFDDEKAAVVDNEKAVTPNEEAAREQEDPEAEYPKGLALGLLTLGLCLTTFVIALDTTIIATVIPHITTVFDSLGDVGWYGSSYLLTTTSLQPIFGKIYVNFNVKYIYLFALVLFEVGSVICATAVNSPMLIVGRAIAGAGASALFSGGMNIIGFSVPLRQRPIYVAFLSSMFGIASVVGPLLGGALTDKVSWRWCFWINLPIGGVAFVTIVAFFKPPKRKVSSLTLREKILELDLLGALFLITAIVCLLLALQWGGTTYAWGDTKIFGLFIGFGLLISCFIFVQFKLQDKAMIPPRIFLHQRTILVSALFSTLFSMAMYTHIFYLPFYFQAVKGTTAEGSGIHIIPYLFSVTLSSIAVGASITVFGPYVPFMWAGAAIFTVGCGLIHTLQLGSGPAKWIGYQLLAGIGAGSAVQVPFLAVQVVLDPKDLPVGNAVVMFFDSLGGAISISLAQSIFSNALAKELPKYAPGVSVAQVVGAGATGLRKLGLGSALGGVLVAYEKALEETFILPIAAAGLALFVSFGMEHRSVKGKKIEMGAVG